MIRSNLHFKPEFISKILKVSAKNKVDFSGN